MKLLNLSLTILLCMVSWATEARTLHSEKSMYRDIVVSEKDGKRCMVFGRMSRNPTLQSCFLLRKPKQLVFSYTRFALAAFTQIPQPPKRILIIGLGGGTLPMTLEELYPEATIDSVEIDPAVISVAHKWFNYRDSERQQVHAVDGRVFVKRQKLRKLKYDVILLDAFNGDYIPEHMMTKEYFEELKSIMTDDGLLIANTFSTNRLYHHESATYQAVFGDYYYLHSNESGNRIIYANLSDLNQFESSAKIQALKEDLKSRGVNFQTFNRLITKKPDWDADARILTDQYSPANLLKY